jgi:hypothetical protein
VIGAQTYKKLRKAIAFSREGDAFKQAIGGFWLRQEHSNAGHEGTGSDQGAQKLFGLRFIDISHI